MRLISSCSQVPATSWLTFAFTLCLMTCVSFIQGCATTDRPELTEREVYELASTALKSRNFGEATRQLEVLESRYPFGRYAEQAQLDLIYARYSSLDVDGAMMAADRFIRLHPDSSHVDYAYYIRGIANYNYDVGLAARWFPIDETARDAGRMKDSFRDFQQLTTRFPASEYAADARQRMIAVRNRLAAHEFSAVKYYIRREAYLAAAHRCQYILENYPDAPTTETALIYMVELYRLLDQPIPAQDALSVLAINYPDSQAFDKNMKFVSQRVVKADRSLASLFNVDWFD